MSNHKTVRVTEFKGLNKATNPHNIKDNELLTLENIFVTKNHGLESRKGYRRIGSIDCGSNNNYVRSIYTTPWSSVDERLYFVGNGYLAKMSDAGVDTLISSIDEYGGVQFDRYKDKVLFQPKGNYLNWFNSDEELSLVRYPEMQASTGSFNVTITNAEAGLLEPDTAYQYCISLVLGDDYLDGESAASRPSEGYKQGPMGATTLPASHPFYFTTDANKTIVATNLEFSGSLHGFNVGRVNLYRRKVQAAVGGFLAEASISAAEEWRLIDTANVTLNSAAGTYSMDYSTYSFITDVTGTLSGDEATFLIDFTDTGVYAEYDDDEDDVLNGVLQNPWEETDVVQVRANYMGRLYNRIFLAGIVGTGQVRDAKKVYYSYRGYNPALDEFEIPGVSWPHPMLIFPQTNYFYCDAEAVDDPITGIKAFRDSIIIFTERCMFLWREGMSDPIKISGDVGCVSERTIVEFEGHLIWLAHNGIYIYNGDTLENITQEKMQPYMDTLPGDYVQRCHAVVYDRKYFIAGPFEGGTLANMMLVYDFDVKAWHTRVYRIGRAVLQTFTQDTAYIDAMFVDRDGADETLYAALKNASAECILAKLEYGYRDQLNPASGDSALGINVSVKTAYWSGKAPDIEKAFRNLLLDADNYYGDITLDVYVDDLVTAKESFTHRNNVDGFTLGSATLGVLGTSALKALSDEIFRFSLPRGLVGSRMQYSAELVANTAPLYIHLIGFDWTPRRGLKRKYGA